MTDQTDDKVEKSEQQWRQELTPEQFQVARQAGTEAPFSGEYNGEKRSGTYHCVCCGAELFSSGDKYDSGSGWPSYTRPADGAAVEERTDGSLGMMRTEVVCGKCDAHLGHVFPDGPQPTGLRYCINSVSLDLKPDED